MSFAVKWSESKEVWDNFAITSPQYSIFIDSRFLDSLLTPYQLITLYDDKIIEAGLVLFFGENDLPLLNNMPYTQYQGMIIKSMDTLSTHTRFNRQLKVIDFFLKKLHEKYNHFCLSQSWKFEDIRPFLWHNYHDESKGVFSIKIRYTAILDLKEIESKEKYLLSIRDDRRLPYNKAIKNGYSIEISDDIDLLNDLHSLTFQRQNITVSDYEQKLLLSISETAIKNGYGKLMFCKNQLNEFVNATLFISDLNCSYYLFGANHPDFRKYGGSNLLLVENIMSSKEQGLKYVDFVGANSPQRGDFKTSFNAKPVVYFELSI